MKTYINIKLAAALGCVMLLGGCSLDVDNKANVEAGKQLSTDEGIESLRTYMYSTVKPLVNETNLTEWAPTYIPVRVQQTSTTIRLTSLPPKRATLPATIQMRISL